MSARPTFQWAADGPGQHSGTAFFNLGDMALMARFDDDYVARQIADMMQRAYDKGATAQAQREAS
jgi:hypothetical protein